MRCWPRRCLSLGLKSRPADILAGIGPSIGPDHYEVGPDVIGQFREAFGGRADQLIHSHEGRSHLDLWTANRLQLQEAGVEKIEAAGGKAEVI